VTGSNVALSPQSGSTGNQSNGYGCGDWIDAVLNQFRVGSCEGLCSDVPDQPYVLDGNVPIMGATAGRWAFCGEHLGPADALGMELGPGCRIFFLVDDASGLAVRGTEFAYQADYDIIGDATVPSIDLHFSPTHTETFTVEAYRCPERVILRQGERAIELARLDGHGGTGVPVK
jgi:hypothetical protein